MKFDKAKVFTAVNADELKKGDKVVLAPTMHQLKIFVEKDFVSTLEGIASKDEVYRFQAMYKGDLITSAFAYLVEQVKEKKWRPYKDISEMISDFCNRFVKRTLDASEFPMIWIMDKSVGIKSLITDFLKYTINISNVGITLSKLFDCYTYLDGSPCGVEE